MGPVAGDRAPVRVVARDRLPQPHVSLELVGIEAVLFVEDSPDGGVELGLRHVVRVVEAYEVVVVVQPGKLDIQPGVEGRFRGARLGADVENLVGARYGPPVAENEPLESEVGAQDVRQRVLVDCRLRPVHRVVGRHRRRHAGVLGHHAEVTPVDLSQRLLVHVRDVRLSTGLHVVGHVVLGVGGDVLLNPKHHRRGEAARLIRILAVHLLRAAPVRVAEHVHAGRQEERLLGGLHLVANRLADRVLEVEVEGRAAGHADRKFSGVADLLAVFGHIARMRAVDVLAEVHAARGVPVAEATNRPSVLAALSVDVVLRAGGAVRHSAHLQLLVFDGDAGHRLVDLRQDRRIGVGVARAVFVDDVASRICSAGLLRRDDVLDVAGGDDGADRVDRAGIRCVGALRRHCASAAVRHRRRRERAGRHAQTTNGGPKQRFEQFHVLH